MAEKEKNNYLLCNDFYIISAYGDVDKPVQNIFCDDIVYKESNIYSYISDFKSKLNSQTFNIDVRHVKLSEDETKEFTTEQSIFDTYDFESLNPIMKFSFFAE